MFLVLLTLVVKEDAVVGSRVFFFFHVDITVDVAARRLHASIMRVVIVKEEDGKKQHGQILSVTKVRLTTTIYHS